ncbi:MAG: protein-L-isoaspartate(D-aspartate) O-methyltransferase [Gallionellaceae bacterium]|nr:protein-L-isoaspartate(D-aspartate) O-methyltransferase [Gallionellaceae bacterium]
MDSAFDQELEALLAEIAAEMQDTQHWTGRARLDRRVIEALRRVPRHVFVPDDLRGSAYANHPLPIGHGQTISQPYVVALMTDLVRPRADDVVLEIGTGSGYQAAVLACLAKRVYTMEIVAELAELARERLHRLGHDNIEVAVGDGHFGWPAHAPYDAIVVTAATPAIPPALLDQLKPGGRLVIPVGPPCSDQELRLVAKDALGMIVERGVLPVVFVPLVGGPA